MGLHDKYQWSLKLRPCKKTGCDKDAAIGEAYCSKEHAPLAYLNPEDDKPEEVGPIDPHQKFKKQTKRKEFVPDDMDNWESCGYFEWNER